jgi:GMP synthase (glutamine-hydrolysing)
VVFLAGEPVAAAPRTISPTCLTTEALDQLRAADHLVTQALTEHDLLRSLSQACNHRVTTV